jgi:hypothetical protein
MKFYLRLGTRQSAKDIVVIVVAYIKVTRIEK